MGIAEIKANARRALHGALSVSATLRPYGGASDVMVSVRWHSKTMLYGADASDGYAQTIEGLDSIIFNAEELHALGVVPNRGDVVTIHGELHTTHLVLEEMEPIRGPIEHKWRVSHR